MIELDRLVRKIIFYLMVQSIKETSSYMLSYTSYIL